MVHGEAGKPVGKVRERVIRNGRTTIAGGVGGAVSAAALAAGYGVTDWRILAGAAAAGLITGAVMKDPQWLKKRVVR
jgi:tetrahydromethanopterin S-methyltransferase subunit D